MLAAHNVVVTVCCNAFTDISVASLFVSLVHIDTSYWVLPPLLCVLHTHSTGLTNALNLIHDRALQLNQDVRH